MHLQRLTEHPALVYEVACVPDPMNVEFSGAGRSMWPILEVTSYQKGNGVEFVGISGSSALVCW